MKTINHEGEEPVAAALRILEGLIGFYSAALFAVNDGLPNVEARRRFFSRWLDMLIRHKEALQEGRVRGAIRIIRFYCLRAKSDPEMYPDLLRQTGELESLVKCLEFDEVQALDKELWH